MTKVKIKHPNPHSPEAKDSLLRILGQHDVYLNRAIPGRDGFIALLNDPQDADRLFKKTTLDDLGKEHFLPILPPAMKAKRTVLLFSVDAHILKHTPDEIKDEIQRLNDFTSQNIETLFKFPNNAPIMKITFQETPPAQKCLEAGLRMFNLRIPAYNIKQEEYIPIQTCMRCYGLEKHNTPDCPKDRTYQVCSECATEGHNWQTCKSSAKKCLNCGGDHRTLAHKCPVRKSAIQRAKEELEKKKSTTYSNITASNIPTMTNPASLLDPLKTSQMFACMLQALVIDLGAPGTYEKALHDLFVAQDIPPIKVPNPPNSGAILRQVISPTSTSQTPPITVTLPESQPTSPAPEEDSETSTEEEDASSSDESDQDETPAPQSASPSPAVTRSTTNTKKSTKTTTKKTSKTNSTPNSATTDADAADRTDPPTGPMASSPGYKPKKPKRKKHHDF